MDWRYHLTLRARHVEARPQYGPQPRTAAQDATRCRPSCRCRGGQDR